MRRAWLAVVVLTGTSGCYATSDVPATHIASIERPLSAPRQIGGAAKLGPNTEIRAWLTDGSVTPWLPAGGLAVAKDGLVSGRRHPLASATSATIANAGAPAAEMLVATAPPDAVVAIVDGELRLTVADRRVLLPWIAAYASGARAMRQPLGWVAFEGPRRKWTSDWIPISRLVAVAPSQLATLEVAEGIPWRDVVGLQVNNLEPIRTTGAIIAMPIAMSAIVLSTVAAAVAVADGKDPTPAINLGVAVAAMTADAAESADAEAGTGGAPVRSLGESPAVLVVADGSGSGFGVTPLFSGAARRRETFKFVFTGEAGLTGEGGMTGSAGLGFRAGDFVELSARLRALPFDGTAGWTPTTSSAAPVNLLYGGRLAFHIDGDGDRRSAFVFGGELLGGSLRDGTSLIELGFVLGPRFGLTDKTFASLLFAPSLLIPSRSSSLTGGQSTIGQLMVSVELGFAL
jgi:hypothetical protein